MSLVEVVVTYLEFDINEAAHVSPGAAVARPELRLEPRGTAPVVAAAMYRAVGGPWHWVDRLPWSDEQWASQLDRDDVELWVASVNGRDAGYFELHVHDAAVELGYFGLLPEFTGRGIGGPLLVAAIDRARALDRPRMTVNTCTLDHPSALANYRKHGFVVMRTETVLKALPS